MLKKIISCLMVVMLISGMSACGHKEEKEVVTDDNVKSYEDNSHKEMTEDDIHIETEEDSDKISEDIVLSADEQYKINIFLSNFAELYIKEYDTDNVDDISLINFAHAHAKVNDHDKITYDDIDGKTYEAITIEEVNRILDKYLGKKIEAEEGHVYSVSYPEGYTSEILFQNGKFNFEPADGESFSNIAVADKMTKIKEDIYEVEFTVYSILEYSTGGNIVNDKNYYYTTPDQAENSSEMEEVEDGKAVVKYKDGKYQLIKYNVN